MYQVSRFILSMSVRRAGEVSCLNSANSYIALGICFSTTRCEGGEKLCHSTCETACRKEPSSKPCVLSYDRTQVIGALAQEFNQWSQLYSAFSLFVCFNDISYKWKSKFFRCKNPLTTLRSCGNPDNFPSKFWYLGIKTEQMVSTLSSCTSWSS